MLGCAHIAADDNALRMHYKNMHADELKRAGYLPSIVYEYDDDHLIAIKRGKKKELEAEIEKLKAETAKKKKNWLPKTRQIDPRQGPMAPRVQGAIVSHLNAAKKQNEPELPDLAKDLRKKLTHYQPTFAAGRESDLAASAASSTAIPPSSSEDTPAGCKWKTVEVWKELSPVKETG